MLNLKPKDIFAQNYQLRKKIDTGGFAEVWQALYLKAHNEVALKIYPFQDDDGNRIFEAEFTRFYELTHTHLIKATHFDTHEGYPFLVMPLCRGGNANVLVGKMNEETICKLLSQIGSALEYLHKRDIVYQDIKPNNFLLDKENNFYLSDLGLSLKLRTSVSMRRTQKLPSKSNPPRVGQFGLTPNCYQAPELYETNSLDKEPIKATDIWALGASIFELITGKVPFGEHGGLLQKRDSSVPDLPNSISKDLNNIISWCLSAEPWDRPTAIHIIKWAQNFRDTGNWFEENDEFVYRKTGTIFIASDRKSTTQTTINTVYTWITSWTIPIINLKKSVSSENEPITDIQKDVIGTRTSYPILRVFSIVFLSCIGIFGLYKLVSTPKDSLNEVTQNTQPPKPVVILKDTPTTPLTRSPNTTTNQGTPAWVKSSLDAAKDHCNKKEFTQAKPLLNIVLQYNPNNAEAKQMMNFVESQLKNNGVDSKQNENIVVTGKSPIIPKTYREWDYLPVPHKVEIKEIIEINKVQRFDFIVLKTLVI